MEICVVMWSYKEICGIMRSYKEISGIMWTCRKYMTLHGCCPKICEFFQSYLKLCGSVRVMGPAKLELMQPLKRMYNRFSFDACRICWMAKLILKFAVY